MYLRVRKRDADGKVTSGENEILAVLKRHPAFLKDLAESRIELVFTEVAISPEKLALVAEEQKNARS